MCCDSHPDADASERRSLGRRHVLVGGLAAGLAPLLPRWSGVAGASDAIGADSAEGFEVSPKAPTRDFAFLPPRPSSEVHQRPIMFPVLPDATLGKATWTDTYLAPRSNGRHHEGQDLMGKKMLKLLACTNGVIVELRHQSSGNSLYLKGDDGYYYCYLHINNDRPGTDDASNLFGNAFAPGMAVGKRVAMGDHIAYLGDSGNAEGTGSHCHFEIRLPNAKWYNAAACNPKYSLQAAQPAKLRTAVPASAFAPLPSAERFALQVHLDFHAKNPTSAWLADATTRLESGTISPDAFIEQQLANPQFIGQVNTTIRLYQAYFGGVPAYPGVAYWMNRIRGGQTLDSASAEMAASSKFTTMFDVRANDDFVAVYLGNLYGKYPSPTTVAARVAQLASGVTRGRLVRIDCESATYRTPTAPRTRVISVYHAMLKESPSAGGLDYWANLDQSGPTGMQQLIRALRTSAKYADRFS